MDAFAVPRDLDLADLHGRLGRTRYPSPTPGDPWAAGVPPEFLRRLVEYWLDDYDWQRAADSLNRFPHSLADVDGARVHYVHAANPGKPAVVLLHGWPYTFAEMLPLVDRLAGDFDVVVPSLPGFVYSPPLDGPFGEETVTDLIHRLMTDVLGHEQYLSYGEDVGTWVSDRLAGTYPDHVAGIAVTHPAYPPPSIRATLGTEATQFFAALDARWAGERGYSEIQATKPDTLAAGLSDSPAGLAAWIVEKFRTWSDCGGDLEQVFTLDDVITTVMLYWTTGSIGTSFRAYYEDVEAPPQPPVRIPAAIGLPRGDRDYPRSLAEHTYRDIREFRTLPRGGHFTAREVPDDVARLIRTVSPSPSRPG